MDNGTLGVIAADMKARAEAERIMRDSARREGSVDVMTMHGDRAQAFDEAARAVLALMR